MKSKMKGKQIQWVAIAFLSLTAAACGGGGGTTPTGDGTTPTLGITSIQKMGATALPNSNVASKPILALNRAGRGIDFLFGNGVAIAQTSECIPGSGAAVTSFAVPGGKIWVSQAYAILDEVEFNREPSTTPSPEFGPFALDLTNTDGNVGEGITVNVPEGNYSSVKYRIKRVEDTATPILNVIDPGAFRSKILDNNVKRRPSVWIEGAIGVGSDAAGFSSCKEFTFVTDHRWEVRIPFRSASVGSTALNAVLLFDLEGAFKSGMSASTATALNLTGEVGAGATDNMGPQYLDGRTKDPDHGTPTAEAITAALRGNVKVFAQSVTAARGFDDNPSASDLVTSTAPAGTTVIDDSATRISGDDNPSISDLTETPG